MEFSRSDISSILVKHNVTDMVAVVAVRGGMEPTGMNKLGVYDDPIYIHSPATFREFRGNTDPSRQQIPSKMNGMATLTCGTWKYKNGIHHAGTPHAYPCFVQAADVMVTRFGSANLDTGDFGIHIHRGDYQSTSSEGCQTLHPEDWLDFFTSLNANLKAHKQDIFPYLLVNNYIAPVV